MTPPPIRNWKVWQKNFFGITMSAYDGAEVSKLEVSELVGLFLYRNDLPNLTKTILAYTDSMDLPI